MLGKEWEVHTAKKRNSKRVPLGYSVHHREPIALGGKRVKENEVIVRETEHKAWTILFDSHPMSQVAELFEKYRLEFGDEPKLVRELKQICFSTLSILESEELKDVLDEADLLRIKALMSSHRKKLKKARAWRLLFRDLTLEEKLAKINNVWIDPRYRLVIRMEETKRVAIITTSR